MTDDTRSERLALAAILAQVGRAFRALDAIERGAASPDTIGRGKDAIRAIEHEARTLMAQVQAGVHINPPLVVFGNPPLEVRRRTTQRGDQGMFRFAGTMSEDVHQIKYRHREDDKDYVHDFESGDVEMYAVERGISRRRDIMIVGGSGQPLWKDFT